MALDISTIVAGMEAVLDDALAVIPGNPALFLPAEKELLHVVLSAMVSMIDSKVVATTQPPAPSA